LDPSHVCWPWVAAPARARGSIRLSLGIYNTEAEVDDVLDCLPGIIARLRANAPASDVATQPPIAAVRA